MTSFRHDQDPGVKRTLRVRNPEKKRSPKWVEKSSLIIASAATPIPETKELIYCIKCSVQLENDDESEGHRSQGHTVFFWGNWDGRRTIELTAPIQGTDINSFTLPAG